MKTRWVFCSGMRRSASTWQYLITVALLPHAHHLGFVGPHRFGEHIPKVDGKYHIVVAKSHVYPPFFSKEATELFSQNRHDVLHIIRDIRDVACSMLRVQSFQEGVDPSLKFGNNVAAAIRESNSWIAVQNQQPFLLQRYEDVVSDYYSGAWEIYSFLSMCGLEPARNVREIVDAYMPEEVDRMSPMVAGSGQIVLHRKHVGDGLVGKWRTELPSDKLELVNRVAGAWLRENGYE